MALNFPSSPTENDIYTYSGNSWIWNGYAWDSLVVDLAVTGNLSVSGNLTVSGGVTSSFSETVLFEDNILLLNSNITGGAPSENAGIEVSRGASANVKILWNEASDVWQFTNNGSTYYNIPISGTGPAGATGATGATGTQGIQGVTGPTGSNGTNGATGIQGIQGVTGATGSQGVQGVTGPVGNYVVSFNGITGAVTGVTAGGANTFTALQTFSAGISAAGGVMKLKGGTGDSYIEIVGNTISIGDIDNWNSGTKILFDTTEYVTVTGKLAPQQLVWENDNGTSWPPNGNGANSPIYIKRWDSNEDPIVYTYPFSVSWNGAVIAYSVTTTNIAADELIAPFIYIDKLFPGQNSNGTLYINSYGEGSQGYPSITHIGATASGEWVDAVGNTGDYNNTYITVDDSAGNITVSAPNGTVSIIGGLSAAGATFSGNFSGATASFSKLLSASAGISASGATFSGNISAPNIVNSFNGSTGAVVFSSYVASVNGVTGAIVGVGLTSGKLSQFASTTSAELAGVVSDETGSGALVFGTSPSITTALNTASASFNLLNTTATSLFIGSAATTGRLFGYTGNLTATQSVTVAGANTGVGVNKTVNIGTGSGLNGTVTVNVGQAPTEGTGTINLLSNTAVSGTLNTSGNISAPNIVNSFNGSTGAVVFSSYVTSFNGLTGAVTGLTQGATGPQGVTGSQGIQGATGNTGATGSQGIQGVTGNTGATGAQGVQGVTGPVGNYVVSFNGLTGAVTGVTAGGANTFTQLNSFSAGVSASALTVSTTGTANKTSSINMASGAVASNQVTSQIILNAYNADSGNLPPVPYTRTGVISADSDYDLKLRGGGDSYISILNDSISIGDVGGANYGTQISFDNSQYVIVNGKLKPDQLAWEADGNITSPGSPSGHPIYIRRGDNSNPIVYTYPFYVSLSGAVTAFSLTTDDVTATNTVTTSYLYADNIMPMTSSPGTVSINCDSGGGGGGSSITQIGDLAGDNLNTFITVDDTIGNVDISAPSGQINLYGAIVADATISIGPGVGLLNSTSTALGTTAANQTITQVVFSTAHRSAEFFVQASTAGGAYEALKIMVVHDGTTTYNTQYGVVRSGASLGTYTTTLATVGGGGGSRIRLRVTPTAVNTTYKTMITALPV